MGNKARGRLYVRIEGIYCENCVNRITNALKSLDGVREVTLRQNVAEISGDNIPSDEVIIETVRGLGYETDESRISETRFDVARSVTLKEFLLTTAVVLLAAGGIRYVFGYNVFNAIPTVDSSVSYAMLFVTGLLTGIHCISMCGAIGIYASAESNSVASMRRPLLYNTGRVISYTIIGGVAGAAGSVFSISTSLRGVVIIAAAALMLLMALSMLGVIRFSIPHFISIRVKPGKGGPLYIGLLNGLMPCGPLQAMQLYALSTGSFLKGALSMALFALGTVPLMLASGAAISASKGKARIMIGKIASVLMLILAVSMLNRGLLSLGVNAADIFTPGYDDYIAASIDDGIQTAEFDLEFDSYGDIVVQKGIPARITVHADPGKITGCNNEIVSRDFGFDVPIVPGDNVIEFVPDEEGEFVYTCWMNMISNRIKVIDDMDYFSGGSAE